MVMSSLCLASTSNLGRSSKTMSRGVGKYPFMDMDLEAQLRSTEQVHSFTSFYALTRFQFKT